MMNNIISIVSTGFLLIHYLKNILNNFKSILLFRVFCIIINQLLYTNNFSIFGSVKKLNVDEYI